MEFAVLEMIHKLSAQHDAIYGAAISDLQKKMEILPSALSRLLRGMEEKGLCVRSIDPKDRTGKKRSGTLHHGSVCPASCRKNGRRQIP